MGGHYAIKSMVLIDFMDVRDIAIAIPFRRRTEMGVNPSFSSGLLESKETQQQADVHLIAV
jgi:hypothetical protein